jgi:hypothetical protein
MPILHELIEAVADAKDTKPEELEFVLEDHISTEAIQQLEEHENDSWKIQFGIPNHTVEVLGDGTIIVDGTQKRTHA